MIGTRIKELRLKRKLSLTELARRANVSKSLISQVERGRANPSIDTIREIALALEAPLFSFFLEEDDPKNSLVKKDERIKLIVPGSEGIRELLTPDLDRNIVLVYSRLGPLAKSSPSPVTHKGEECTYVLKGTLIHVVEDQEFVLEAGDTFSFDARVPHLVFNPSDSEDAEFIAAMSPGFLPLG